MSSPSPSDGGGGSSSTLAGVIDLHGFDVFAAAIFVELEGAMVLVGVLDGFAHFGFRAGNHFIVAQVRERLGAWIISAFQVHDAGAHVIDPGGDEFLFGIVIAFGAHAFEFHVLHFAVGSWHLHFAGVLGDDITTAKD